MKIVVIGDFILDEYLVGHTTRISPEAPVPVITNAKTHVKAGGAANVALNIKSMGSSVQLISQADRKTNTKILSDLNHFLLKCELTPKKTRIITNNHIICRIDTERYQQVTPHDSWITSDIGICVLSDYNKGVLDKSLDIIEQCNSLEIPTIVDPKKSWYHYKNCWLLKSNFKELIEQLDRPCEYSDLPTVCETLSNIYGIENLIITLGGEGMFVYTPFEQKFITAQTNSVIDVTGAGDVVLAALAHYINNGLSVVEAAERANKLASISVSKQGSYIVSKEDIDSIEGKVVFTNGCFDVLHKGHIDYLRKSKSYGTKLIVGLNSDSSVRQLKGNSRPINTEQDRKAMLESLEFVDEVIIFNEQTPKELITKVKPDIITKGGDYTADQVVGNDLVNQVIIIPLTEGYSTTNVIGKINNI